MKLEYKQHKKQNENKKKSHKLRNIIIVFVIFGALLFILFSKILFPISKISVEGNKLYSMEDVLSAAAINIDTKLFSFTESEINNKLTTKLPYIKNVKIERKLPGTVKIKVTESSEDFGFYLEDMYYITDSNYKVISVKPETSETTATVFGVKFDKTNPGRTLKFSDEKSKELFLDVYERLNKSNIKTTIIDINDISDIKVVVNGGINVYFGKETDINLKINHLKGMLKEIGDVNIGKIDLRNWTSSSPKGFFSR